MMQLKGYKQARGWLAQVRGYCFGLLCCFAVGFSHAEQVTLALEDADIQELIRWASEVTDKAIIVHPNVKGKVSVMAGEPLSKGEAYQVFLSVLQVHGFSAIESEGSIKIIPDALAKQSTIPYTKENSKTPEDMVVRIIRIKNVAAPQLVALLRPLVPQVGHLAAYPQTNVLIIADRAGNIDEIEKIVRDIDQVGTIDIEVISLKFASARDVVGVVTKLVPGVANSQSADGKSLTFAADERSNSILTTGDPVTRQQLRTLISRLDQPLSGEGNTQVIYIHYANATDLVPILQGVSGSIQKADKDQPFDSGEVSIQVSKENNALIITAPPALLNTIRGVIAKLDIRRQQVMVEAVIVEVNQDVMDDLGIQWTSTVPGGEGVFGGFKAIPNALTTPEIPNLGSGLALGYFKNDSLRALIRALEADSNANILSTPTIVTLDNEDAEILVGSNVPFITGSQTNSASSTDNPFQTIERQDIGVTLKVKPRINQNHSITLDIEQTVESISTAAVSTADIVTNKRNIKTRVLLDNDQVLVLGGLIKDEFTQNESRIPVLGRIPGLGRLFRSTSTQAVKNNLMVFIHPVILSDEASADEVTTTRYNEMRARQKKYNDDTDWILLPKQGPLLPELKTPPSATVPEI